jgi:YbgC/YbaW family acyl-CoA thioester hydrolase
MIREHRYRRIVQWQDTDLAGIIHFSNYFRYMEEAQTDFLIANGLDYRPGGTDYTFLLPRVSSSCDFKKPVTFRDEIDVYLRVIEVGKSSIHYEFSFQCKGEEVALGKLSEVCGVADGNGGFKSAELPAKLRGILLGSGSGAAREDDAKAETAW